jgi:hypothetical protein
MQTVSELPAVLMFIKMGTAVLMVVVLSVLAEAVSPKFAGILSGYPLGAAISLFFMGFEIGPEFAAQSALYTMLGLVATLVFAHGYYRSSALADRLGKGSTIVMASVVGVCGYFLAAWGLHLLQVSLTLSLLLSIGAILLCMYLFRNIEDVKIEEKVRPTVRLILLRALFAACAIVLITSTARVVGPGWAGLFAAFPMTTLPLVVIIHYTYDASRVHAVLKSFPKGLGSLVVYTLAVFMFYPLYGIYLGTLTAYGFATLYLVLIQSFWGLIVRPWRGSEYRISNKEPVNVKGGRRP